MSETQHLLNPYCYICLSSDDNLIRPCINIHCTILAHEECLIKQINSNTTTSKCGNCQTELAIEKTYKFDWSGCYLFYGKILYALFLFMVFPPLSFLWGSGRSINNLSNLNYAIFAPIICVFVSVGWSALITIDPTFNTFIIGYIKEHHNIHIPLYVLYGTVHIMILVAIFIAHVIGWLTILVIWGKIIFFTAETCGAGLVVYAILLGIVCIVALIRFIYRRTRERFNVTETKIKNNVVI